VGGRRSQRPVPSPTLGSLGPSHHRRHKSQASLRGPPCAHDVSDIPLERCATGPVLWRLKHFSSWTSAAWRLSEHDEGIYIPSIFLYIIYFIFVKVSFDWKKESHLLGRFRYDIFLQEKNLYY
jgi:hypothetical protein